MNTIERLTIGDFARIKNHIYFFAIGVERNQERLSYIPHKAMGDIALVYAIKSTAENGWDRWLSVNYKMLKELGISEKRLHDIAQENSLRDYPADFFSLNQMLEDTLGTLAPTVTDDILYVLTNRQKNLGAAVLFYPDMLEQLQKRFPQGYYVLPSSIHECIILPKNDVIMKDKKSISDMVKEINIEHVKPEEQLSDYAHQYDAKKHTLVLPEGIREKMIKPDRKDRNNPIR